MFFNENINKQASRSGRLVINCKWVIYALYYDARIRVY